MKTKDEKTMKEVNELEKRMESLREKMNKYFKNEEIILPFQNQRRYKNEQKDT